MAPTPSASSSRTLPPKSAATLAGRAPAVVPDRLCLLCASTVPSAPSSSSTYISSTTGVSNTATKAVETTCCRRPICGSCCGTKGRAARWDPCLLCAKGRPAPRSTNSLSTTTTEGGQFVLGDDDEDDGEVGKEQDSTEAVPHAVAAADESRPETPNASDEDAAALVVDGRPVRHIVRKGDTLIGIALKYGADPHQLCVLNRLPPSTIHTTPHLVQTRASLLLVSSSPEDQLSLPEADRKRLAHERALVRFGRATKETDDLVTRAYVGLAELEAEAGMAAADSESELDALTEKIKEKAGAGSSKPAVEDRAVNRYLDDAAWESAIGPPPSSRAASGPSRASSAAAMASSRYPQQAMPTATPIDWAFGRWGAGKRSSTVGGFIKLG